MVERKTKQCEKFSLVTEREGKKLIKESSPIIKFFVERK